jgi:hypothetical protein
LLTGWVAHKGGGGMRVLGPGRGLLSRPVRTATPLPQFPVFKDFVSLIAEQQVSQVRACVFDACACVFVSPTRAAWGHGRTTCAQRPGPQPTTAAQPLP